MIFLIIRLQKILNFQCWEFLLEFFMVVIVRFPLAVIQVVTGVEFLGHSYTPESATVDDPKAKEELHLDG